MNQSVRTPEDPLVQSHTDEWNSKQTRAHMINVQFAQACFRDIAAPMVRAKSALDEENIPKLLAFLVLARNEIQTAIDRLTE